MNPHEKDQRTMFLLIMPSYNQSHFITEAIDSILAQSDPDWALWIIDNSTDDTPDVVRKKYTDPRIVFHHIPERMDPGTCINWALERTHEHLFSYVHTDNRLEPDYVSKMKKALEGDELGVAYCDSRIIDDHGDLTSVFRRGSFDLAQLASLAPLGVPFSATSALAERIGGFSTRDVADDVLFCLNAYGIARFSHIPDALVDYRAHQSSRTTEHGGRFKMEISFLKSYLKAAPAFKERNISLVDALKARIATHLLNIELLAEDVWYRKGRLTGVQLAGRPTFQTLWNIGLFKLPDFKVSLKKALKPRVIPGVANGPVGLASKLRFKIIEVKIKKELQREAEQLRNVLLPWLVLNVGSAEPGVNCWLGANNVYTLWAGKMMEKLCGWHIHIHPTTADDFPDWLGFELKDIPASSGPHDVVISIGATKRLPFAENSTLGTMVL